METVTIRPWPRAVACLAFGIFLVAAAITYFSTSTVTTSPQAGADKPSAIVAAALAFAGAVFLLGGAWYGMARLQLTDAALELKSWGVGNAGATYPKDSIAHVYWERIGFGRSLNRWCPTIATAEGTRVQFTQLSTAYASGSRKRAERIAQWCNRPAYPLNT